MIFVIILLFVTKKRGGAPPLGLISVDHAQKIIGRNVEIYRQLYDRGGCRLLLAVFPIADAGVRETEIGGELILPYAPLRPQFA